MPTYVSNNGITEGWTVLDVNDVPLTGVTSPAGIQLVLMRQSGTTMIAAGETVTWVETATAGRYAISFTPTNTGHYVLYGKELHASSLLRTFEFRWFVVSAGAVFSGSYANAFCAESDIERWLQQAISGTSTPSDMDAAAFAEERAAVLMALLARHGHTVTPATVTVGSILEDLLRRANSIGAAIDYIVAQSLQKPPSTNPKGETLEAMWLQMVGDPEDPDADAGYLITAARNVSSLATNHILSGDTLAATVSTPPTDTGVGPIGMGSLF